MGHSLASGVVWCGTIDAVWCMRVEWCGWCSGDKTTVLRRTVDLSDSGRKDQGRSHGLRGSEVRTGPAEDRKRHGR